MQIGNNFVELYKINSVSYLVSLIASLAPNSGKLSGVKTSNEEGINACAFRSPLKLAKIL